MPVNKVEYFGETLMDISDSTITPETLMENEVAYDKAGNRIIGKIALYEGEGEIIQNAEGVGF